jgi:hypothetical protein
LVEDAPDEQRGIDDHFERALVGIEIDQHTVQIVQFGADFCISGVVRPSYDP